jgi:hypothetical protein
MGETTMSTPATALITLSEKIGKEGLTPKNAAAFAAEIAKTFNVREHEVGILVRDKQFLRFLYPARLASAGAIPISASTVAVAARVVNTKTPEAINNLAHTKHASVFEAIELQQASGPGRHPTPEAKAAHMIQKMMTVPLLGPAGVLGIIEVSRKGKSAPEAGPDFSPSDLHKLVAIATSVAKNLK